MSWARSVRLRNGYGKGDRSLCDGFELLRQLGECYEHEKPRRESAVAV